MPTYAPKPAPGPLSTRISSSSDAAKERADIISELGLIYPFLCNSKTITIAQNQVEQYVDSQGATKYRIRLEVSCDDPTVVIDNPIYIVNPPVKVHDGTHRIEQDLRGNDIDVPNYKEDPEQALKDILSQLIG